MRTLFNRIPGLKQRFLIVFLALFLLTAIAAFFAFKSAVEHLAEQLGAAYASKYALANRSLLQEPLVREIALARQLADSPTIRNWARSESDPGLRRQALAELESYRRRLAEKSWFCVIDSSRHYYYDDREDRYGGTKLVYTLDRGAPKDAWYFATLREVKDYALNVNYDPVLDVRKVWINVVMREPGGRALGITGTGLDLSEFLGQFFDRTEPGVENVVLDRNLAIQAHRNHDLIDQHSVAKSAEQRSTFVKLLGAPEDADRLRAALERLRNGSEAETLFITLNGKRQLAGATYQAALDWYILTILDLDQVIGRRVFVPLLSLGIVVALILIAVVGWTVNAMVLAPLATVTEAARRIADGDHTSPLTTERRDEIGTLKRAFSGMLARIQSHTDQLESRVRERTAELTRANSILNIEAASRKQAQKELADKIILLEAAMAKVKRLEGTIPICTYCKKIRDDKESWHQMERYISDHSDALFSHGICPECAATAMDEVNKLKRDRNDGP